MFSGRFGAENVAVAPYRTEELSQTWRKECSTGFNHALTTLTASRYHICHSLFDFKYLGAPWRTSGFRLPL